jgi:hypothetical protein
MTGETSVMEPLVCQFRQEQVCPQRGLTDYHDSTDPVHMTSEQPIDEVAAILAGGVLRLRRHAVNPINQGKRAGK